MKKKNDHFLYSTHYINSIQPLQIIQISITKQ